MRDQQHSTAHVGNTISQAIAQASNLHVVTGRRPRDRQKSGGIDAQGQRTARNSRKENLRVCDSPMDRLAYLLLNWHFCQDLNAMVGIKPSCVIISKVSFQTPASLEETARELKRQRKNQTGAPVSSSGSQGSLQENTHGTTVSASGVAVKASNNRAQASGREQEVNESVADTPTVYQHIPMSFRSFFEYVRVWEPLLIEEIKSTVLSNFISLNGSILTDIKRKIARGPAVATSLPAMREGNVIGCGSASAVYESSSSFDNGYEHGFVFDRSAVAAPVRRSAFRKSGTLQLGVQQSIVDAGKDKTRAMDWRGIGGASISSENEALSLVTLDAPRSCIRMDRASDIPTTMDLILLSTCPLEDILSTPYASPGSHTDDGSNSRTAKTPGAANGTASSAGVKRKAVGRQRNETGTAQQQQLWALGIVTAVRQFERGGKCLVVKVHCHSWKALVDSVNDTAKTTKASSVSAKLYSGAGAGASAGASAGAGAGADVAMGRGEGTRGDAAAATRPVVEKSGRMRVFNMHFTCLEGLQSSWREFLALHELGSSVPLLRDVLCCPRRELGDTDIDAEIEMVVTPTGSFDATHDVTEGSYSGSSSSDSAAALSSASLSAAGTVKAVAGATKGAGPADMLQKRDWNVSGAGLSQKFLDHLRRSYNLSQLHAIRSACNDGDGFTLVQGPPGSGKTSTIIGILNVLHLREYNSYYEKALAAFLGPSGNACRRQTDAGPWLNLIAAVAKRKPRLLVVAPSNTAVDNIIQRIMKQGFKDGQGNTYFPKILRIGGGKGSGSSSSADSTAQGTNKHGMNSASSSSNGKSRLSDGVKAVSLDELVEKELQAYFLHDSESSIARAADQSSLAALDVRVGEIIRKVHFTQSQLLNMSVAFEAHHSEAAIEQMLLLIATSGTGANKSDADAVYWKTGTSTDIVGKPKAELGGARSMQAIHEREPQQLSKERNANKPIPHEPNCVLKGLPVGWELRVSMDTAVPYWVDHTRQCNSPDPPPPEAYYIPEISNGKHFSNPLSSTQYTTMESLPEHKFLSHRLTTMLDDLEKTNLKRSRMRAIQASFAVKTGGDWGARGSGGGGWVADSHDIASSAMLDADVDVHAQGEEEANILHRRQNQQQQQRLQQQQQQLQRDARSVPFATRQLIEQSVIDTAHIIFTTLNSSGSPVLEGTEFVVTLIDEAAQCVEPSVLIPLRRGCRQCVMVGDQMQLPATVFSDAVNSCGYDRSLFERLIDSGHDYVMLDTQYRMHPSISAFPSTTFYGGQLRDGSVVKNPAYLPKYINENATPSTLSSTSVSRTVEMLDTNHAPPVPQSDAVFPSFAFFNLESQENEPYTAFSDSNMAARPVECSGAVAVAVGGGSRSATTANMLLTRESLGDALKERRFFDGGSSSSSNTNSNSSSAHSDSGDRVGSDGFSKANQKEAVFCVDLVKELRAEIERCFYRSSSASVAAGVVSIGVITPYNDQLHELRRQFRKNGLISERGGCAVGARDASNNTLGGEKKTHFWVGMPKAAPFRGQWPGRPAGASAPPSLIDIELNTVDGFQGKEKDIIIFSCVRANMSGNIGFLADVRRMNVALTRPKFGLYIVGHAQTLGRRNKNWAALLAYAAKRDAVYRISSEEKKMNKDLLVDQTQTSKGSMSAAIMPLEERSKPQQRQQKEQKKIKPVKEVRYTLKKRMRIPGAANTRAIRGYGNAEGGADTDDGVGSKDATVSACGIDGDSGDDAGKELESAIREARSEKQSLEEGESGKLEEGEVEE